MSEVIIARGVGKRFRRYHPERPHRLKELLLRGGRHMRAADEFWGVRHVNMTVAAGRSVGVIGHNGAGKSTLLRLIGGVGRPDEGFVATRGRIGALLELGAGTHPDLSGRDNIVLSAVIGGLTRREALSRLDAIVEFAELEEFVDAPLRTYSGGMQMRLAFAVAVHTDPDILLIDEVLSVGDAGFQRKCLAAIRRHRASGCGILLISHDMSQIRELCDEVYWLAQGRVVAHGAPEALCARYTESMAGDAAATDGGPIGP